MPFRKHEGTTKDIYGIYRDERFGTWLLMRVDDRVAYHLTRGWSDLRR